MIIICWIHTLWNYQFSYTSFLRCHSNSPPSARRPYSCPSPILLAHWLPAYAQPRPSSRALSPSSIFSPSPPCPYPPVTRPLPDRPRSSRVTASWSFDPHGRENAYLRRRPRPLASCLSPLSCSFAQALMFQNVLIIIVIVITCSFVFFILLFFYLFFYLFIQISCIH